ncbi:hypothetical protein QVD17_09144 [Tagetes erecta]|uniref:Uncharacterized protein n=1 Tax=Tagetes erecta TaxID=13708 RepID=A0AAD8L110_TARER|nr:hypothetical protein QVD17_09144 [Tagetes erecta]
MLRLQKKLFIKQTTSTLFPQTKSSNCQTLAPIADDIVIRSSIRHQALAPINHSSSEKHHKPSKSITRELPTTIGYCLFRPQ